MNESRYNKSEIMKRAWSIFRSGHSFYSLSFSVALERAWEIAKEAVRKEEKTSKPIDASIYSFGPSTYLGGVESYYRYSGQYSGD